jgi:hypothetical protein
VIDAECQLFGWMFVVPLDDAMEELLVSNIEKCNGVETRGLYRVTRDGSERIELPGLEQSTLYGGVRAPDGELWFVGTATIAGRVAVRTWAGTRERGFREAARGPNMNLFELELSATKAAGEAWEIFAVSDTGQMYHFHDGAWHRIARDRDPLIRSGVARVGPGRAAAFGISDFGAEPPIRLADQSSILSYAVDVVSAETATITHVPLIPDGVTLAYPRSIVHSDDPNIGTIISGIGQIFRKGPGEYRVFKATYPTLMVRTEVVTVFRGGIFVGHDEGLLSELRGDEICPHDRNVGDYVQLLTSEDKLVALMQEQGRMFVLFIDVERDATMCALTE